MLLNYSLFTLLCLLLLPQVAQSTRARFFSLHPRHHAHRHHHASPLSHIGMVAGVNQKLQQHAQLDLAMVTAPVQEFGGMLDTPVSGPNPGGNSENLAVSGPPNMLSTLVSGPNPGGNSQSLLVSGPNPGGNSNTLAGMLDTPVSGPNPGGNSNTLLGSMFDTPVSGPNPGSNSEGLFVSVPNRGGNDKTSLAGKFDKPLVSGGVVLQRLAVSTAADRHSNVVLTRMLDTPVSGPNPGGNSATLGGMLDTSVSGTHPGGNSQVLAAIPSPILANSQILAASSGPNPGGNSRILASSGPNPGGNSVSLTASDDMHTAAGDAAGFFSGNAATIGERDMVILSASSGPNPGGNSASLGSSKYGVWTLKKFVQSASLTRSNVNGKAEAWHAGRTVFSELPRASVPPSGPNPSHNSVVTNQGLFAERKLRGVLIGCDQDGEEASGAGRRFHGHLGAYINTIHGMGTASLNTIHGMGTHHNY